MEDSNMTDSDTSIRFEEGQPCPVKIEGSGGGLSFSPNGDMLLLGAVSNPTDQQVEAWGGQWRAKLISEAEFPSIPIFSIGSEDWILEAPCNPAQQNQETPDFLEALYAKDEVRMGAILVDSDTDLIRKISTVELDEMFVERLVLSWNPFRTQDQYNKSFSPEQFSQRVQDIFKTKSSKELWMTSW